MNCQPLVPAVSAEDGQWLVKGPFAPVCKPGGHGAIWKLAYDKGIFKWFYDHGRKGATIRQVRLAYIILIFMNYQSIDLTWYWWLCSNVVAATDLTLLALAGIGLHHGKVCLYLYSSYQFSFYWQYICLKNSY